MSDPTRETLRQIKKNGKRIRHTLMLLHQLSITEAQSWDAAASALGFTSYQAVEDGVKAREIATSPPTFSKH